MAARPLTANAARLAAITDDGTDRSWHLAADCTESEMSFAVDRSATLRLQTCGGCRVRTACLAAALRHPELAGIFGGATANARAAMLRASRAAVDA